MTNTKPIRLAKRIADAGFCSRRQAEVLINDGRVSVNGKIIHSPATTVTETDDVMVDGDLIATKQETRMFMFYKPLGVLCTAKDPQGRPTVFDGLPKDFPRVVTVGRLDINSEGLLILTTDGGLAQKMMRPETEVVRTYRVRVFGNLPEDMEKRLSRGITVDGVKYRPISMQKESKSTGKNHWLKLSLQEGKNREIRKVMKHFGLQVNRLIRIKYGDFSLGKMQKGEIIEISPGKIKKYAQKIGLDG